MKFEKPSYVGDPINAVRIFNEKEVDELTLLDIEAGSRGTGPDFARISSIVDEAFMPVAYGGGIATVDQVRDLISLGVEKVVINSAMFRDPTVVQQAADLAGSQAVVVSVNVRRDWLGRHRVHDLATRSDAGVSIPDHLRAAVAAGAGELFINDMSRDGTGSGFDLDLVRAAASSVSVPVIVCGGAGTLEHMRQAVEAGASAVAAGSMFVYVGKYRAVMINYPQYDVLRSLFR